MNTFSDRLTFLKGTPYEAGYTMGARMGKRLEANIERYLTTGPGLYYDLKNPEYKRGALPWLEGLPIRFKEELEGVAEGAGISLQRLAEWYYAEEFISTSCTGFLVKAEGRIWAGKNNDYLAPDMWGYACVREINGRIPWIGFGLEGDIFTITGMNRERLWLHSNYLPVDDFPNPDKTPLSHWVWLADALETCTSLKDIEDKLGNEPRTSGMLLFAVDGKTEDGAIYECTCRNNTKRELAGDFIAGTNTFVARTDWHPDDPSYETSECRLRRTETLLGNMQVTGDDEDMFEGLRKILADDEIEARGEQYYTVYSCIACPGSGDIRYTFGGYPAAGRGAWQKLPDLVI